MRRNELMIDAGGEGVPADELVPGEPPDEGVAPADDEEDDMVPLPDDGRLGEPDRPSVPRVSDAVCLLPERVAAVGEPARVCAPVPDEEVVPEVLPLVPVEPVRAPVCKFPARLAVPEEDKEAPEPEAPEAPEREPLSDATCLPMTVPGPPPAGVPPLAPVRVLASLLVEPAPVPLLAVALRPLKPDVP